MSGLVVASEIQVEEVSSGINSFSVDFYEVMCCFRKFFFVNFISIGLIDFKLNSIDLAMLSIETGKFDNFAIFFGNVIDSSFSSIQWNHL